MSENAAAEQMAMPKHGEFCWTEIATNNLERCKTFYSEIFGWKIEKSQDSENQMEYLEFSPQAGINCGGMYEINEDMGEGKSPPPHFMNYIAVDDVDASASKAFDLGGTIVHPPTDIPNVGRFCVVKDPTGATFSILTLKN